MTWRHAAWVPLVVLLAACGADGGSRGTGIETIVQGNVASVQSAQTIAGIRVMVEGTSAQDVTDADGHFSVQGTFDGRVVVLFRRPADAVNADLPVNVPGGGTLTLNNVQIDGGGAVPESQNVDFVGVLTGTDCSVDTALLRSIVPNDTDRYTLQLATSSVHDAQGNTLTCVDLQAGDQASVEGAVNPDGSFGNAVVEVQ